MKTMSFIYLLFISSFILLNSCQNSPLDPKNPIFSGTVLIDVTGPSVSSSTNFPDFIWKATGLSYEVVGVFTASIVVEGKQIVNKTDCIAMWTTGMTGSAGNVNYVNFRRVVNGALTSTPVVGLGSGSGPYYWAVWAYTAQMVITNSSAQFSFTRP